VTGARFAEPIGYLSERDGSDGPVREMYSHRSVGKQSHDNAAVADAAGPSRSNSFDAQRGTAAGHHERSYKPGTSGLTSGYSGVGVWEAIDHCMRGGSRHGQTGRPLPLTKNN